MNNDEIKKPNFKIKDLGFDAEDDILYFMHNDSTFFRKDLYPLMLDIKKAKRNGKDFPDVAPCVNKAIAMYCKKFDINPHHDAFNKEHRKNICDKIISRAVEGKTEYAESVNFDELSAIKKLAGIRPVEESEIYQSINKSKIMKENNIQPGSKEWFKLWFSKPGLTGEQPY